MHHLLETWFHWVLTGGYIGIIVLMAMESSIFPVPSEIVIPPAAFLAAQGKLSFTGVVLAGVLGSYLGSAITYWASRLIGRPLIVKYVRFVLVTPKNLESAEQWLGGSVDARRAGDEAALRALAVGASSFRQSQSVRMPIPKRKICV